MTAFASVGGAAFPFMTGALAQNVGDAALLSAILMQKLIIAML